MQHMKARDRVLLKRLVREMSALKLDIRDDPGQLFCTRQSVFNHLRKLQSYGRELKKFESFVDPDVNAANQAYNMLRQTLSDVFEMNKINREED